MHRRENCLENLEIWLEHDDGWEVFNIDRKETQIFANKNVVICGETTGAMQDCYYIHVDPGYTGALSPGQQKLYEILRTIQEAGVYTMTTIGKLTHAQGLENPEACGKRLENLRSLGAISWLDLNP